MKLEIKPMDKDSAVKAAELEVVCFSSPWPAESFINILNNNSAAYFIAFCDDKVVGYVGMYDLIDEVSIINIAVSPDFRRGGIAQKLLEKTEEFALSRGCPSIALEVRESNIPARSLYEKNGYKVYGRDKDYYSDPREDAILYSKAVGDKQC